MAKNMVQYHQDVTMLLPKDARFFHGVGFPWRKIPRISLFCGVLVPCCSLLFLVVPCCSLLFPVVVVVVVGGGGSVVVVVVVVVVILWV